MIPATKRRLFALIVESLLVLAVLASVANIAYEFHVLGYLRQPYMYNPNDTFMDWFNVLFWAHQWGAYEVWRAVYPPLSFLFVKVFSIPYCSLSSPFYARDCDWVARATILSTYAVAAVTASRAFYLTDRSTALHRSLAFTFGLPMLYALERGNLILLTLIFFIIAYGGTVRSPWLRWVSAAITINLKPYMILPLASRLIKRDWRGFEIVGFLTLMIYLVSWAIFEQGSIPEILDTMRTWATSYAEDPWQPIFYTTTYAPMLNFATLNLPVLQFLPSDFFEFILIAVPVLIYASQLLTVICAAGAWLHPTALPRQRMATLLLACGLVSESWGGYTQTLLLFLVFLEPWKRPGQVIACLAAYALSLSFEVYITLFPPGVAAWEHTGWLSGRELEHRFGLGWGIFIRPGLVAVILWALAIDTLHLLVLAHRREPVLLGFRRRGAAPQAAAA